MIITLQLGYPSNTPLSRPFNGDGRRRIPPRAHGRSPALPPGAGGCVFSPLFGLAWGRFRVFFDESDHLQFLAEIRILWLERMRCNSLQQTSTTGSQLRRVGMQHEGPGDRAINRIAALEREPILPDTKFPRVTGRHRSDSASTKPHKRT